jgi:tRNA threonylcarbamoyladenosine biosynthesis protein TsaB
MPERIILAMDTATGPCSVAVWRGGKVAAYLENTVMPVLQSACLLPMVEAALAECGVSYTDISVVVSTTGPGSFTGIRIALATAQGIAFAAKTEGLGYTTLDVLAHAAQAHAQPGQRILAILNAGKGEYYYQFAGGEPMLGALTAIIAQAGAQPVLVAGNIAIDAQGFTASPVTFPRADALAALAAAQAATAHALKPFYIRSPDAKLPAKKA